jgi:hypothetical protein
MLRSRSMRTRSVLAVALGVWGGAIFWACGDTSFGNGDATNDGGGVLDSGNGDDGSSQKDGNSTGGDGGTSGDGGVSSDACAPSMITPRPTTRINCPGADSGGDGTSTCATTVPCCIDDGTGSCTIFSCNSGAVYRCEKSADCTIFNGRCCLDYGFDTPGCPERTLANGSSCASSACAFAEHTLCASPADCIAVEAGTSCTPVEVDYNGTDASTLLGYCTP